MNVRKEMCADRQQFIDCVTGNLLTNEEGVITNLGDAATQAVEAAERGETVTLTVNGVPFSKIVDMTEVLIKKRKTKE